MATYRVAIIEFYHVGNVVKVSAVDPETMIEVSIIGSPLMNEKMLTNAALRKLRYVMNKKAAENG